jgi:hypothetical protein
VTTTAASTVTLSCADNSFMPVPTEERAVNAELTAVQLSALN